MNRDCKKYLKEVRMLIPLNGRLERKFLHNMRENLEDFYSENKNAIYSDICHHFGTPKDKASATASAIQSLNGKDLPKITKTVTLTCSATGKFS